jgi:uncharacterized protein (TIGR02231 family)
LGKSNLNTQTTNDTLSISLGTDKNIVVTRTKLKEYLKKEFLGNEKQEERAFEINIRNKKNQYVQVIVEDRMPVTNDKEIIVKLEDNNGNAKRDEATGKLRWTVQMEPRKEKKIGFRYSVKYPKEVKLSVE